MGSGGVFSLLTSFHLDFNPYQFSGTNNVLVGFSACDGGRYFLADAFGCDRVGYCDR